MPAFLVIERPNHNPHVLGAFSTRRDAEEAREILVADDPGWETFVSIQTPEQNGANEQRRERSLVVPWLAALLVVDVVLAYALYLVVRALVDLV
jgi:hypothetical protein